MEGGGGGKGPAIQEKKLLKNLFFRRPFSSKGREVEALMALPFKKKLFFLRLP